MSFPIVRHKFVYFIPECLTMMRHNQVRQFVDHNVVQDFNGYIMHRQWKLRLP